MYNLLITAKSGAWKKNVYEYDRGRALHEYTDDDLEKKFAGMTKENIAELMAMPCLFAYEGGMEKARLGWLTNIKPRDGIVRIEYELEQNLPQISEDKLKKLTTELDITDWELSRTHWAVKDVNLVQVLKTARILTDAKIRGLGSDSKLARFGLTRQVTELQIRPSVFRIPAGKVEEDLVSVMMPFSAEFTKTFDTIKRAGTACRLRCQRADNIWNEEEVIQDVFSLIYRSRVVICDFTNRNPNVFYEAGIAHTLGKPVIMIAQSKDDVPFDLRHLRYVTYHPNSEGRADLQKKLSDKLGKIIGSH